MSNPQTLRRADREATDHVKAVQTRRSLVEALRAAADLDLESPSVTWICRQAGVGRSTFYTHFATIEDLALFTITEAFAATAELDLSRRSAHEADRRTIARAGLARLAEAFDSGRDVIRYAIRIGSRGAVIERLVAEFMRLTGRTVALEYRDLPASKIDVLTAYVSAGTVRAFMLWLEEDAPDRDELIDQLLELLPPGLAR
ncbi:hypothetical protein [Leifsonia poae]|uniref:hypothetical protein n=1 Tax=Leifsonia poae TaxID=110933 RepID=UPI003D67BED6